MVEREARRSFTRTFEKLCGRAFEIHSHIKPVANTAGALTTDQKLNLLRLRR